MKEDEYEKLKEIYEKKKSKIPKYNKCFNLLEERCKLKFTTNKLLFKLNEMTAIKKNVVNEIIETNTPQPVANKVTTVLSTWSKGFNLVYKHHMLNYQTILARHKKLAAVCSREARRSMCKTGKINPLLKSKKISKELGNWIKKALRGGESLVRTNQKEIQAAKKKQDEIEEANRQKRKFNYLLSQTETFAKYFLNRKSTGANDEIAGIKAAQEQIKRTQGFSTKGSEKVNELLNEEVYVHKSVRKPKMFMAELRDYQLKGLNWLVSLYNQGINGILADDMGLGKTIQSLAMLSYLYETNKNKGPFLVVTPASTLHNWVDEIERFLPNFKTLSFWGSLTERREMRRKIKFSNVIVTSYQIAIADENYLRRTKFQYMILDEAQAIKSSSSLRWHALLSFKARNRLLLTGTPIQNNMNELWALLHFIMPTLFDSISEFSEWFSKEIENNCIDDAQIEKLHTILKPFMLRRHKSDIKDEIGTKEIINIECTLSNRQKSLYNEVIKSKENYENIVMQLKKICNHPDLLEKIEPTCSYNLSRNNSITKLINTKPSELVFSKKLGSLISEERKKLLLSQNLSNISIDKRIAREKFTFQDNENPIFREIRHKQKLMRCLCSKFIFTREHTMPFIKELAIENTDTSVTVGKNMVNGYINRHLHIPLKTSFIVDSGKLVRIESILEELKEENHRVLIYFQMTRMMDLFEKFLQEKEINYLRLDGSSKISARKDIVKTWQTDSSYFVFILSTRAGGVGLNLTAADTVIFFDSDWNPTVDQQAMDRVHRIGQTKDVTVYKLVTTNTIEERVMEMANKKDEIQKIVIKEDVFTG